MEAHLNHSGIPDNISSYVRFENCTLASDFAALYWRIPDIPLKLLTELLRDSLSDYLSSGNRSQTTDWELLSWFGDDLESGNGTILWSIADFVNQNCVNEVCPRLGGRGDADIAGLGMQINYVLMAILTTVYWFFSISHKVLPGFMTRVLPNKGLLSARYSIRTALDTAIVFNLAMLVAATANSAKVLASRSQIWNVYSSSVANYVALWSVLPVMSLQHSACDNLRRTKSRAIVYCIVVLLMVVIMVLWPMMLGDPPIYDFDNMLRDDTDFMANFNSLCLPPGMEMDMFQYSIILVLVNAYSLGVAIGTTWPGPLTRPKWRLRCCFPGLTRCLRRNKKMPPLVYRVLPSTFSCMGMWLFFILLYNFHRKLLAKVGSSNKERELSFGQILSLATWLPVLTDFGYVYVKGPRDALTGQLVKPYCAEVDDTTGNDETELSNGNYQRVMETTESTKVVSSEETKDAKPASVQGNESSSN